MLEKIDVKNVDHRIVGGTPARKGRYPFAAGLLEGGQQFCGGSLIAPNVVLSAAHCEDSATQVALGCIDITDLDSCEVIDVERTVLFPGYDDSVGLSGDISVLILKEESKQAPVAILSPDNDEVEAGLLATVIGWGNTNPTTEPEFPAILQETNLFTVESEECNEQYLTPFNILSDGALGDSAVIVDDTAICTVGDATDSCQGDSGGPLFFSCDGRAVDVQFGVVSFGLGCAYNGLPGVYAKTYFEEGFEFIKEQVEAQGHSLTLVEDLEDHCPIRESHREPTPFPTFIDTWTCDPSYFSNQDGCDCECGQPDPDCEFDDTVFGCGGTDICVEGVCSSSLQKQELQVDQNPVVESSDSMGMLFAGAGIALASAGAAALITLFVARSKREERGITGIKPTL